jgi:hypothetical protein
MKPPQVWSDAAGWDAYHRKERPNIDKVEKYDLEHALRFVRNVYETPHQRIWFAGCGVELGPWLYANLGCDVVATDISPWAITFQNELLYEDPMEVLEKLPNVLKEMELPKARNFIHPAIFVHDMRTKMPMAAVDMVVNRRAFHGFSQEEKEEVAGVYFEAMHPGGLLICDTLNVQGEDRNMIENALLKAGFFIPGVEADQWYRQQLSATGIEYAMVLGNPIIPQWGQYKDKGGKEQEAKDKEILRGYREEYYARKQANALRDKEVFRDGVDKLGIVIYSTG